MDRRNIKTLVNLTGGFGAGLTESIKKYDAAHPGRFITFTEPAWNRINQPRYAQFQADEIFSPSWTGATSSIW